MGNLPPNAFDSWLSDVLIWPRVFIEVGTFKGVTAALASERFALVHTIEASPAYHLEAVSRYGDREIRFHLSDSRDILPKLAAEIAEPVVFFHDGHAWNYPNVVESFPLWDDLATMAKRDYQDVIVVDEVHRFGDSQPRAYWKDVSLERIAACFPGHQRAFIAGNQAVVIR